MVTTANFVCPKCGTIAKSGIMSCCGRGGAWFKKCGGSSNGNTRPRYTWYEGIQSCTARTKSITAVGQQGNAAQQKAVLYFYGVNKVNSDRFTPPTNSFTFSFANMPSSIAVSKPFTITSNGRLVSKPAVYTTYKTHSKPIVWVSIPHSMAIPSPNIRSTSTSLHIRVLLIVTLLS